MSILSNVVRRRIFQPYSIRFKNKRKELLYKNIQLDNKHKILDFGGNDGSYMDYLIPTGNNEIYIADILEKPLKIAETKYGYKTILLDESGQIPFENNFFDIVFCNSVIEHVTVNKDEMNSIKTNKEFKNKSIRRQRILADEIRRVSRRYFVQTPNKHFIIDSHTWFPAFYNYLPRLFQIRLISVLNKYWIKKSSADVNLLTTADMKELFPDAEIFKEKSFFMTKSIIAIRK